MKLRRRNEFLEKLFNMNNIHFTISNDSTKLIIGGEGNIEIFRIKIQTILDEYNRTNSNTNPDESNELPSDNNENYNPINPDEIKSENESETIKINKENIDVTIDSNLKLYVG